ncbi:MAG: CHAD domain-containing protein [Burkholderiales bacterium]|nr:CHAD domain-containing protein [Burkholderiales bacterium]
MALIGWDCQIAPGADTDLALRQMVAACLRQIVPNAQAIAAGVANPEHLHQLRIGLRGLRSALHVFSDWSSAVAPDWQPRLGEVFIQLGRTRDRDMLQASVLPDLRAVHAPLAELPPAPPRDLLARDVLNHPDCTQLFRDLIAFADGSLLPSRTSPKQSRKRLRQAAGARFAHLHRQLLRDAKAYPQLNEVQRHRVRKRLKRLRYGVELLASVFPKGAVKPYLAHLQPAQAILGQYNDLVVAEQVFKQQLPADPRAWFALGWIAARQAALRQDASRALIRLARAPTFW